MSQPLKFLRKTLFTFLSIVFRCIQQISFYFISKVIDCAGVLTLTTRQPLWVILCHLPEREKRDRRGGDGGTGNREERGK